MDQAFNGGRKLRRGASTLTVDRETAFRPFTTTIPAAARSEGEPMNNAEQSSFLFKFAAAPTGDIQVERSDEPYFQQVGAVQTITVTDDISVYDVTVRTAGIIRFFNNTNQSVEVTCFKQRPRC